MHHSKYFIVLITCLMMRRDVICNKKSQQQQQQQRQRADGTNVINNNTVEVNKHESLKKTQQQPVCTVRVGVIDDTEDEELLSEVVQRLWVEMKRKMNMHEVEMVVESCPHVFRLGMNSLMTAHMSVGNNNKLALIGPYSPPFVVASLKYGTPYFIVRNPLVKSDPLQNPQNSPTLKASQHRPPQQDQQQRLKVQRHLQTQQVYERHSKAYNLISTRPNTRGLSLFLIDLLNHFRWFHVALLYVADTGSNAVQELSKLPNIKTTVWILPGQIMSTDQPTSTKTKQQQQQQPSINNNYDEGDYYEEVQRKVRSHDGSFNDRLKRDAATEAGDRMMENFDAEEDDKTVENVLADEKMSIEGKIKNILLEVRNLRIATIVLINFDNLLNVQMILSEALKLSLLTNRQNWIMLGYDPLNFDPTPFAYTGVNFITTQLGNQLHSPPPSPSSSSSSSTPASTQSTSSTTSSSPPFNKFSNTDVMLIKDSLLTLYRAIMMTYALRHNCTWKGQQDINSIRLKISEKTESGQLKFLKDGSRVGYFLDVLWLRENGFKKMGIWKSSTSDQEPSKFVLYDTSSTNLNNKDIDSSNNFSDINKNINKNIMTSTSIGDVNTNKADLNFVVVTSKEEPLSVSSDLGHRHHGYAIDFLRELSKEVNFRYEVIRVDDDVSKCVHDVEESKMAELIRNKSASLALFLPLPSSSSSSPSSSSSSSAAASSTTTSSSATHGGLEFSQPITSTTWNFYHVVPLRLSSRDRFKRSHWSLLTVAMTTLIKPFPLLSWLLLAGAVFLSTMCLFVLTRISQAEIRWKEGVDGMNELKRSCDRCASVDEGAANNNNNPNHNKINRKLNIPNNINALAASKTAVTAAVTNINTNEASQVKSDRIAKGDQCSADEAINVNNNNNNNNNIRYSKFHIRSNKPPFRNTNNNNSDDNLSIENNEKNIEPSHANIEDKKLKLYYCCCCYNSNNQLCYRCNKTNDNINSSCNGHRQLNNLYSDVSLVHCLWIVATMITLRDLNSPIRIMHRTKGGKIFSLTLRCLSLLVTVCYASSLASLLTQTFISAQHHQQHYHHHHHHQEEEQYHYDNQHPPYPTHHHHHLHHHRQYERRESSEIDHSKFSTFVEKYFLMENKTLLIVPSKSIMEHLFKKQFQSQFPTPPPSSLYSSFSPSSSHKQNDENEKAWVKLSSSSKIIYLDKLSDDNYLFQTLKTKHGGMKSGKPVSNSPPRLLEWFFSKSADLENDGSRKDDSVNIILLWHSMAAEHFNKQQLSKTSSHQPQQQQQPPPPLQPQHIDDYEDSKNVRLALNELKFPGLSMDVISLSMAFHSSFPFKQSIHSAVESLAAKGTLQELNRRWSSSAAPSHPHRDDEDEDEDDVGDDDTGDMKSGVASFTIGLCMLHCFILLLIVLCSSLHYYKMKSRQSLLDEMESDDAQESSAAVKSSNNNVEAPITATTTTAAEFSRSLDSLPTTSNSADQLQRIRNSNFFDDRIDEFDFANNYFQDKEEHQLFQMPPCLSHPYHHHHHFHDYHSTHPHHITTNYFERHQFPKVAYDSIDSERSDSRMHLTQKRRQYRTTQPHQLQQKLRLQQQQQQQQRQYHTLADRRSEHSQQQKSTTSTISRPHKCKRVKGVQCQDDSGSRSSSFPLWRRQTNIF